MGIDRLKLILCDMYQMDAWMPPLRRSSRGRFQNASWSRWALDELEEYISNKLYPRNYGTLEELCAITKEFMLKMKSYTDTGNKSFLIFSAAQKVAADVLDLLRAMM